MKQLCELKKMFHAIYLFEAALKKDFGLSINEALSLCSLESGPRNSNELARDLGISLSRISRVLGSLEQKGFVRREITAEDKRKVIFSLLPAGKKRLAELHRKRSQFSLNI